MRVCIETLFQGSSKFRNRILFNRLANRGSTWMDKRSGLLIFIHVIMFFRRILITLFAAAAGSRLLLCYWNE